MISVLQSKNLLVGKKSLFLFSSESEYCCLMGFCGHFSIGSFAFETSSLILFYIINLNCLLEHL